MKLVFMKILDTLLAAAQRAAEGLAKVEVTTAPAAPGNTFAHRNSDLTYPGSSANMIHRNNHR